MKSREICITICGLFFTPVVIAQVGTVPLEVEPYIGAKNGDPYNSVKLEPAPANGPCVDIESHDLIEDRSQIVADRGKAERITSHSELIRQMNMTAAAALKAASFGGTIRASSKYQVLSNTKVTRDSETNIRSSHRTGPIMVLDLSKVRLKPSWQKKLSVDDEATRIRNVDDFRSKCGDSLVIGSVNGDAFYATHWQERLETSEQRKHSLIIGASYNAYKANFKSSLSRIINKERRSKQFKSKVTFYSTLPLVTKPEDLTSLKAAWNGFKADKAGIERLLNLYVVSYERVPGFPKKGVLNSTRSEELLLEMVGTLWDLRGMREESTSILKNESAYAFGLSARKIRSRRYHVKKMIERWNNEYDWLKQTTESCLHDFTPRCKEIAGWYQTNPMISERKFLPKAKKSFCKNLNLVVQFGPGKNGQKPFRYPSNRVWERRGDKDMDGNQVRLDGRLRIRVDGNSTLKAVLRTTKTEINLRNKRKHRVTKLDTSIDWILFELSTYANNKGENPLTECVFHDDGVKLPRNRWCPGSSSRHGFVSTNSTVHSRGPVTARKRKRTGCGYLESIECELDGKGDDHKRYCFTPKISSIPLDLVNRKDVKAERFQAPRLSKTPNPNSVVPARSSKRFVKVKSRKPRAKFKLNRRPRRK